MATSGKRSEYGLLVVDTEKSHYYPGETVTGTVKLVIEMEYPGVEILVKIFGKEGMMTLSSKSLSNKKLVRPLFKQTQVILDLGDSSILPGKYEFPFKFILPSKLPASFLYDGSAAQNSFQRDQCFITYGVKCHIPVKKIGKSYKIPSFKRTIDFYVNELMTKEIYPVHSKTEIDFQNDLSLLVVNDRRMTATLFSDKNAYQFGEIAQLKLDIDVTHLKVGINYIEIQQKRDILVALGSQRGKLLSETCSQVTTPGVSGKEQNKYVFTIQFPIKPGKACESHFSVATNLIKHCYYFEITFSINDYIPVLKKLILPIHIYQPPTTLITKATKMLLDFTPKVFPTFEFAPMKPLQALENFEGSAFDEIYKKARRTVYTADGVPDLNESSGSENSGLFADQTDEALTLSKILSAANEKKSEEENTKIEKTESQPQKSKVDVEQLSKKLTNFKTNFEEDEQEIDDIISMMTTPMTISGQNLFTKKASTS